jgi:virginiamycin B lyase
MYRLLSLLLFLCAWPYQAQTLAAPIDITEWEVPWADTRPRDPFVAPDGGVWFVGQKGHYLARLDPRSGDFERFDLEAGAGPHNLIVADDGAVWFAGNRKAYVGKLDPETKEITTFPMPDPAARDPHTLVFTADEDIWFTVQGGNFIGKLTTANGDVELIPVPTPKARPYGIVMGAGERPWIVEFGSYKIATVDPKTMELTELVLPKESSRPRRLALGPPGESIWYVDYALGLLGRLDPKSGEVKEWPVPGGEEARPYAMAIDDHDRLWFVECGSDPNRFVGFDPEGETFFSVTPIPSGGGCVRHMVFHAPTRAIWFGTDANTVGRAQIP